MDVRPSRAPMARPAVAIAGIASVAAGLVHAAAAANHEGGTILVWMFGLCALAQLLWGVVAIVTIQPARPTLITGLVINGGAVVVWALSRTTGIPFLDALAEVEAVGRQDLGAALFAAVSVLATLTLLLHPQQAPRLSFGWVGGLAALALVAALPAMSAEHTHGHAGDAGHDGHPHAEVAGAVEHGRHAHEDDDATAAAHGHDGSDAHTTEHEATHTGSDGTAHDGGHDHGDLASIGGHGHSGATAGGEHGHDPHDPEVPHEHPTDPDDPHEHPTDPTDPDDPDDPHEHPTDPDDPITSIDDPRLTDEQFAIAVGLIVSTGSGLSGLLTEEDVRAAGYTSLGDGGAPGQYTHHVNWSYVGDEFELDAGHIESVVTKMNADGTTRVVAAMYILSWGDTMADAPPLAGELTTWHDHDNLCFEGEAFVALADAGVCPSGALRDAPPMLHVWVEANPCGPFAAIDEDGKDCGATHSH